MGLRNILRILAITMSVSIGLANGTISLREAVPTNVSFHDVESQMAREATSILRAAQDNLDEDNGEEIVFCLSGGIYVQFADGTGRRMLIQRTSSLHSFFSYPVWSLDGARLAFAAVRTDPRVVDLVVANSDGSDATVILTLDEGYYNSFIQSISWHWDNQELLFTYAYNDWQSNSLFVVCGINADGSGFFVGPGPDYSYCQCEPVSGSTRWAYVTAGSPLDLNSRLHVANYDGSNHQVWQSSQGYIARFRDLCWRNSNTIYVVVNEWSSGIQALARVTYPNVAVSVAFSDPGAALYTPTFSPNRNTLYFSEVTQSGAGTMYRCILNTQGNITQMQSAGSGFFCNWRQALPPATVHLTYPNGGEHLVLGQPFTATWTHQGRAVDYYQLWWSANGGQQWWPVNSGDPIPADQTSYVVYTGGFPPSNAMRLKIKGCFFDGESCEDASDGNFSLLPPSSVDDDEAALPVTSVLIRNYPNPFNSTTTIEYALPLTGHVSIDVWNCSGQLVAHLVDEVRPAGVHRMTWNAGCLSSGTYYLTIRVGSESKSQKIFLVK